jgi:Fe-S-cluster-containing hydrogenase component 2
MKAENPGVLKVAPDTRVIIKSQKRLDMGPFIRFSCWHCPDPPCAGRCPFDAIVKQPSGAVSVDPTKCDPLKCNKECVNDCERGGYPKVGYGSVKVYDNGVDPADTAANTNAWKCTLCHGRAGADAELDPMYGNPLPNNNPVFAADGVTLVAANKSMLTGDVVAELAHWPSCVYTCPAKAMKWDTRTAIWNHIGSGGYISYQGDGSMFWASKTRIIAAPKADPFIEDHITPMLSSMLTDSVSKATLVPTLVAGGVLAAIARKIHLANEAATDGKG